MNLVKLNGIILLQKAIYVCSNDSTHTESHDCEVTSEVINKIYMRCNWHNEIHCNI